MQDLAMPSHQDQHQEEEEEEAGSSSPASCSLLDLLALDPVHELIWSGLDSEDRKQLRETCRCLRDEVERSCTTLKPLFEELPEDEEAKMLVKLSGRMPQVRTLHLKTVEAVQAVSLDPPPAGEQHEFVPGTSVPPHLPSHSITMRLTALLFLPGAAHGSRPSTAYFPQLEDLRVSIFIDVREQV
jgi:hypothetical protein